MDTVRDQEITVRLSKDAMDAYIQLPALSADDHYSKEEIMEALVKNKIKVGIDNAMIDHIVEGGRSGGEFLIATGIPAVDGTDGYYEYFFETAPNYSPVILGDGTADFKNIHTITIVEKDQVIAVYHEPILGSNGITVTGSVINGKRGRPQPPITGKGFDRSEDGNTYTANLTGKIDINNNRIVILPVYELGGDLNSSTGNIDFRGDVIIHGNVCSGMIIRATGTVTVDGITEAAMIFAGKDVTLKGGFLGDYKGVIKTKGNLHAKFLEYGRIETDGFIEASSALDCTIVCYDRIYMTGRLSVILGGSVYGARGIEVGDIGNDVETSTKVEVGVGTHFREQMHAIEERIDANNDLLEKITLGLEQFDALAKEKNVDLTQDERRVALLRSRIKKQAEIASDHDELNRIKTIMEKAKGATVRVEGKIFAGVTVTLDDESILIKEEQHTVEIIKRGGKVVMITISE